MNHKLFLILLILSFTGFGAFAQVKTIYLENFGAVANDKRSDQQAFNKAADYINKNGGNVKLVITAGTYLVGPAVEINDKNEFMPHAILPDVMNLSNCKNVSIEGRGKVKILFLDSLPFGVIPDHSLRKNVSIDIGSLFRLINSSNISISNIEADGNNEKFRLLGKWGVGANPYEREHEGIFILNCQDVIVKNVSVHNFGRDGALILQDADKIPAKNISFTNCSFNNNGRNGFSWCGGENVRFYNCIFKGNGTGRIKTMPSAGLDIEPERYALCTRGIFNKCIFTGNGSNAVASGYNTASEIQFDSCQITGNSGYSIYCASPEYRFSNCFVAGTLMLQYDANKAADGTKMINCTFTDSISGTRLFTTNYLVAVTGRYVSFDQCTLNTYLVPLAYTEIKKKQAKDDPENTFFRRCTFNAHFKKPLVWQKNAFVLANCNFVDCSFKADAGYADFKTVLFEKGRNIYQQGSVFK